jgi:hypothetical protein
MRVSWIAIVALILSATCFGTTHGFAWRLFAGREECVSEYLPAKHWKHIQGKYPKDTRQAQVQVDIGFLVTTKHDVEDAKANVDFGLYSPTNTLLKNQNGVTEGELDFTAQADGIGPWKFCVRVSGGKLLRPSVIVDITYFSVNFDDVDEGFDWEDEHDGHEDADVDKSDLARHDQIVDISSGLSRLDRYLVNVTNEQRFLYARTVRHLKTASSTLSRTYWYYIAVYGAICLASVSQILVIRLMFKKVCVFVLLFFCCIRMWCL